MGSSFMLLILGSDIPKICFEDLPMLNTVLILRDISGKKLRLPILVIPSGFQI
jgi:hypothetical protein